MKKENTLLIGILVLVVGGLIYSISGYFNSGIINTKTIGQTTSDVSGYESITTGSMSSGDVSVELTPHKMVANQLAVDYSINTHSVDLSQFNLKQITTLGYNGKTIKQSSALDYPATIIPEKWYLMLEKRLILLKLPSKEYLLYN